jgi:hypothetical protein
MTDELPADAPLTVDPTALAPIRAEAQIALEFNGDAHATEADWPRFPDESYTPEEIAAASGDASAYEEQDALDDPGQDETPPPVEAEPETADPESELGALEPAEFDAVSDTPHGDDELDAFIASMDAQNSELRRQSRQLEALERKMEDGAPCVLA